MKKKGFIFVETIVVLVVTMLSLTMMLSSYLLIVRKNNINKYYNRPSEIYALYYMAKLGTNESSNYVIAATTDSFFIRKGACSSSVMNSYLTNCTEVFDDLNMQAFGIINSVNDEIDNNNDQYDIGTDQYDIGTIEFLDHLQKKVLNSDDETVDIRYAIGVFYIDREYYYASIPIAGGA